MHYLFDLIDRFKKHRILDLSAQCSYYFLLSLFPFLIFTIMLLSYLPFKFEDVVNLLSDDYIPPDFIYLIENQFDVLMEHQNKGLLSFGIIFTMWTASHAMNSIIRSLNLAYEVEEKRGFLLNRGVSVLLTLGMLCVVVIALFLQVLGANIKDYLQFDIFVPFDFDVFRWFLSFIVLQLVFSLLYLVGPNKTLTIKDTYIGSIVATLGWQFTSFGFSYYVSHLADYSATYGSIGTVIVLMLWFHLSCIIIFIGGEVNAMIDHRKKSKHLDLNKN